MSDSKMLSTKQPAAKASPAPVLDAESKPPQPEAESSARAAAQAARAHPAQLTPQSMLALQRAVGNRALTHRIQARPAGEEGERTGQPQAPVQPVPSISRMGSLQRLPIQRLMSLAEWKKSSSVAFSRRSNALKHIDAELDFYNKIPLKNTEERRQALVNLKAAIDAWLKKKNGTSKRMEAMLALSQQVNQELAGLAPKSGEEESAPSPEAEAPESEGDEGDDEALAEMQEQVDAEDTGEIVEDEDAEAETRDTVGEMFSGSGHLSKEDLDLQGEMDREKLEELRSAIMTQRAMVDGWKTRYAQAKSMPPDEVEKIMEELQEQMDLQEEISQALSRPPQADEDERQLAFELFQFDNQQNDINSKEFAKFFAEMQAELAGGQSESGLTPMDVDDPDEMAEKLEISERRLANLEEGARKQMALLNQEGNLISALLPLFIQYKTKNAGDEGIQSDRVQAIIDKVMAQDKFAELYELRPQRGDLAIQKAAEMVFGETWSMQVHDQTLFVINIDTEGALKKAAGPLKAECETILKADDKVLKAAFTALAQAQVEKSVSGETSVSSGEASLTAGGKASGYMGAKTNVGVSAEVDKVAKSIKAVAEAAAQLGMGADMEGFIRAGYGKNLDLTLAAKLSTFFGVKGSAKAEFEATLTNIRLEAQASAMAGVEASGEASIKGRVRHVEGTLDVQGEALAGAKAEVSGSVNMGLTGISLKGEAKAFAGAKVSGSVGGSVGYKGKKMFSVRAKGEALAGAGAEASGEFTFKDGKLKIDANVSATLGVGLGGGVETEIDFKVIGEAILNEMKEFKDMIFPPEVDHSEPTGPRETGLSSESRGKLFMAIYPAFVEYGAKKAKQGESGLKRERLQALLDQYVIRNAELVQEVKNDKGVAKDVPLYKFDEADEVLTYAALKALPGQINSIVIRQGTIRSIDLVAKEDYVGLR